MSKKKLLILTCADGYFGQGLKVWDSMNVARLAELFGRHGFSVSVYSYEHVAKQIMEFKDYIVVYSSTQKPGYKEFLEDVLLGLSKLNNQLVPRFDFFRAHENKGYQEIMRQIHGIKDIKGLYYSGSQDALVDEISFPAVYKSTDGSKSRGVALLYDVDDLKRKSCKYEKLSFYWRIHRSLAKMLNRSTVWHDYITPRHSFVVQEFVPELSFDFKVLVFGKKYFVLQRGVRNGDFRASGSGKLEFIEAEEGLLEYSRNIFEKFNSPFISMDICKTKNGYALIEYQGVHFGPYTLLKSSFHYVHINGCWIRQEKFSVLEEEFVRSIVEYFGDELR